VSLLSIWFAQLSGRWKALIIAFGILAAGFSAGISAAGFTKLPDKVANLEQQAMRFDGKLNDLSNNVAAIRKLIQQTNCLTVAQHEHTDWHKCME